MNSPQSFRRVLVALPAKSHIALRHDGQFLGLFSPDRSCTATFSLGPGYSIDELPGEVEGRGFLVLAGDPSEPIALSIRSEPIVMIEFDRLVKWSSRFPRSIDIIRLRNGEPAPPSGDPRGSGEAAPLRTRPRSSRSSRAEFDGRCDPLDPSRHGARPMKKRPSAGDSRPRTDSYD